jgi:hypothetical protein
MKQISGTADITSNGWPGWIYAALGLLLVGIVGIGMGVAWSRRGGSPTGR